MTDTKTPPQLNAEDLLDEAATLISETDWLAETGWEPFALDVIEAAQRRLDGVPLSDELETLLRLAIRLLASRFSVASALSLIEILPGDPDLLSRDRPAETPCRRSGVQHLAIPLKDGEVRP